MSNKKIFSSSNKDEFHFLLSKVSFEAIFLSEKGICIGQNKTAEEMFGYSEDEAIGKMGTEWIAPEDRDLVLKNLLGGDAKPYEVKAITKNGTIFPCEIQAKLIDYKNKKIRVTALRNISEKAKYKDQLKEKLKELELITSTIPSIIWKANIDKTGRYINTYISSAADDIMELPKGTINNNWDKYFSYVIPSFLPKIFRKIKEGIENPGEINFFDYQIKKGNGQIAWFSSCGKVFFENYMPTIYGFTHDITEQKNHEIEIKKISSEKDKLLAIISHDLRSPFNAIIGFS
ncbi:MAG: PAS domain S-box protein [Bacteroidales bacterium]|nr:PAS domain S-box protein [Bacteroidales bacterium]